MGVRMGGKDGWVSKLGGKDGNEGRGWLGGKDGGGE